MILRALGPALRGVAVLLALPALQAAAPASLFSPSLFPLPGADMRSALPSGQAHATDIPLPTREWLLEQVKALSAPAMDGRASGTPGADRAAEHIARVFKVAGLEPGGDAGSYLQSLEITTAVRLGPASAASILAPAPRRLGLGREFVPLHVSADGAVEAGIVFAGFGITAPDLGYDDYAGLDVRGRIVLVVEQEPRSGDPSSPFGHPETHHYSDRTHKIINAREHGARGIFLVPHPAAGTDRLPPFAGVGPPWGTLAALVTRAVGDALVAPAGTRLADVVAAIDREMRPRSFVVPGLVARLEIALSRDRARAANVVGILPGTDPHLRLDAVVIGAHYDHLGRGGYGSLAPDQVGTIHPGADDNASGTAALMALARAFVGAGGAPRTLVFVAFAGEEMGLLGSTGYVKRPARPLERTALMLNLDMVGRLRNGTLHVSGVDSGAGLRPLVERAARAVGLSPELRGDPYVPSDVAPFYAAGRPALDLWTGAHGDYHRPSDTWEKIDVEGLETITRFAAGLVAAVAARPEAPAFVALRPEGPAGSVAPGSAAYFGVLLELSDTGQPGVPIGGVRSGSPAERLGLRAGDVIIRLGSVAVRSVKDLAFALRGRRPGERVDVWLLRDGREHRLEVILGQRR